MSQTALAVKAKPYPTQDRISECLWYDPETGNLHWLEPIRGYDVFDVATTKAKVLKGQYHRPRTNILIRIDGTTYIASRVIWIMHNGEIPTGLTIDHIDGDPTNNRLNNLRLATAKEQARNAARPLNNTSGYMGVRRNHDSRYWDAWVDGKKLGTFSSAREANERAQSARVLLGYHKNHGRD